MQIMLLLLCVLLLFGVISFVDMLAYIGFRDLFSTMLVDSQALATRDGPF